MIEIYFGSIASFFIPGILPMHGSNTPPPENKIADIKRLPLSMDTEVIEHLGDLYYNTLGDLLKELSDIQPYLELYFASEKIYQAWKISEKYIDRTSPPRKHEHAETIIKDLGGIQSIIAKFKQEDIESQRIFLLQLSYKIWFDAEQDTQRPSIGKDGLVDETKKRTKLATALFEASLRIKKVYLNT